MKALAAALAAFGAVTIAWGVWTWARVSVERWRERNDYERRNPYS